MRRVTRRTLEIFLRKFADLHGNNPKKLLPKSDIGRRYYEVSSLIWLFRELARLNYYVRLENGKRLTLRWSGERLNRSYSYFSVTDTMNQGKIVGEIWTDVWIFSRKSHARYCAGTPRHPRRPDYREVDVIIIKPGATHGQPVCHRLLLLGIECKSAIHYGKHLWGEILGLRHFLSRDSKLRPTSLRWRPPELMYNPPSILIAAALPGSKLLSYLQSMVEYGIQAETIPYDPSK